MDGFQKTVLDYINKNPENKVKLARACKTAVGTVTRWAHGHSKPHPLRIPSVLECIQNLTKADKDGF